MKPTDTIGDVYENIDRYHLNERLGKVLAITQKGSEQPSLSLSWWDECLDKNSHTIDQIEDYIRTYITLHDIDDEESPLWTTLTYIENNNDRMRYVDARAAGPPGRQWEHRSRLQVHRCLQSKTQWTTLASPRCLGGAYVTIDTPE